MIFFLANTPEQIISPTVLPTPGIPTPIFLVPTSEQISAFVNTLVAASILVVLVYVTLFYGLRLLFRRWENELALIALNVSQVPVLALLILVSVKISVETFGSTVINLWINKGLTALIVVTASYWIAQVFTQVIAYYLKKQSQKTEAMWDDVLIPILESVVPIIVYLFGAFLFLQTLGVDLTGLWVALGGATFVLGFALQSILSNFFSGIVLLIDSPFQFGDVVSLPDGTTAIIQKVGIRLTNLFIIDTHCELFIPNGMLERQNLINLSRPAPHYYYSLHLPLRADIQPAKAIKIIREVILAHPDTLGNIDEKLQLLDMSYKVTDGSPELQEYKHLKKELGRERLLAERSVNRHLETIQKNFADLVEKIQILEKGGLEAEETRKIQIYYLELVNLMGFEVVTERQGKQRRSRLEESPEQENTLIGLVRNWYKIWSKDPNLTEDDPYNLQEEWEKKIELLKLRSNKLYQKISQPRVDERKLDDYTLDLVKWMNERFKTTQTLWQDPKAWTDKITSDGGGGLMTTMHYMVKFYVDNIKLERCQRGYRVKSEVQGELIRQLKQAYIYR